MTAPALTSSGEFDIHLSPERFIRALAGYAWMSDQELGVDTFLERTSDGLFVTVPKEATNGTMRLMLEPEPFIKQRAVVCRGTTCYRTHDQSAVVKFSWTSDKRPAEAAHLRQARVKGVEGIARLRGHHQISEIADTRSGLTFALEHQFRGVEGKDSIFHPSNSSLPASSLGRSSQASTDQSAGQKRQQPHAAGGAESLSETRIATGPPIWWPRTRHELVRAARRTI